jgi:hypothetical protein
MTEEDLSKYEALNNWVLPGSIAALAFTYEFSLQKRIGNKVKSNTFLRCLGSATIAFLFTKYVFKSIFTQQRKILEETKLKNQELNKK